MTGTGTAMGIAGIISAICLIAIMFAVVHNSNSSVDETPTATTQTEIVEVVQ